MGSKAKRQQTAAKRDREQRVRQKRAKRLEKKYAAAQERNAPPAEAQEEQVAE
jgi:hypothetical protein